MDVFVLLANGPFASKLMVFHSASLFSFCVSHLVVLTFNCVTPVSHTVVICMGRGYVRTSRSRLISTPSLASPPEPRQALRIEDALSHTDAALMRMSKDRRVDKACWDEDWLVRDASQGGSDLSKEGPDESFTSCKKLVTDALGKLMQNGGQSIVRTFCQWCDQPKKAAPLVSFTDMCIRLRPGMTAEKISKAPGNDCYASFPKSIKFKAPAADVDKYDLLMATLYGMDSEARDIELCGEARALCFLRQPPRCRIRKGRGAQGKMHSVNSD